MSPARTKPQQITVITHSRDAAIANGARPDADAEGADDPLKGDDEVEEIQLEPEEDEKQLLPAKKLEIQFPFFYTDSSNALVLPFTFLLNETRWSEVVKRLRGTHEPLVLHVSPADIKRIWGHVFSLRDNTYHFALKCVRTARYTTHGVPQQLAYNLTSKIPGSDECACWTHAFTVVSGVTWRVPDGHLMANQDGCQPGDVTWKADHKLMRDIMFHRMKLFPDDQFDVTTWMRHNHTRAEVPGPAGAADDALVWYLLHHIRQLDPQPVQNREEEDEEDKYAEDEDQEEPSFQNHHRVSLSGAKVRQLMEKTRQKVNAKKNLLSLNQGLSLELFPVHPQGWSVWTTKQREIAECGIINPCHKDPHCCISVTLELVMVPILAQPSTAQVQTELPVSLGCVNRQPSVWKLNTEN